MTTFGPTPPNTATRGDLSRQTARALARRIRRGEVTASEALEAHLKRIARWNGALNAVVSLDVERARQKARAADAAQRRGETLGPLHGVPLTLKDGNDVAGLRTSLGSPELDRAASEDGTVAARLQAAGAIIVGHTNVPPMLADFQTANPIFGRTCNPWDLARTAGGSSGGAAAAVAAGMTPLEIGSDLAGSIRLPAHFCGVYALKPTEHRVPVTGFFRPPAGTPPSVRIMTTLGPIARDLGDVELALRIVAGPDGFDTDVPPVPLPAGRRRPLEQLRLAVAPSLPGLPVAGVIRRRVEGVAAAAVNAGARVEERLPTVDWESLHALFAHLLTTITGVFAGGGPGDETPTLAEYLTALAQRDGLIGLWERFFEDVDVLVLPAAMTSAFRHCELGAPIAVDGDSMSYWSLPGLLTFCNLTGMPGLVVPAGLDEQGLPISLQFVGPRWSEIRLLDIAREFERSGI
ncbi:MAG TPA: amidase family protein, partial [Limnochordia bacterium]|nr:amidase family protein [Limnochordia bacterium]